MTKNNILLPFYKKNTIEAGCDEAGRGCLAGAVFAAAVILPSDFVCNMLNDSKKLTDKQRQKLRPIIEKEAISWAIGIVEPQEIDNINILNASILAMHKALDQLSISPTNIIVDGNKFKAYKHIPHQTIVKGDSKYLSIAAASVIAKTHRDEYMDKLHHIHPVYEWSRNKGYPTKRHREAINNYGTTNLHRKSFQLLKT